MNPKRKEAQALACPCGTGRGYDDCCGRFLDGGETAATAEQLMRSRYTAYVRRNQDYLRMTWHPTTRPPSLDLEEGVKWLGLRVVRTEAGGAGDDNGLVEFIARFRQGGASASRMREVSRFVREDGRWLYLAADNGDEHERP